MPNYIHLLSEARDGVLRLTLNRPERRNALNPDLVNELLYALELARDDAEVRVVVVTGAGKAFCAGGDFAQAGGPKKPAGYDVPQRGGFVELNQVLRDLGKPTIAMVNGHAMGGGFGLALACDLTIVAESAKLGTPEIDIGLFPMMIMPAIFRHISRKQGLKMILLGEKLSAREALTAGCVTEVVADEALAARVDELARALSKKSGAILRLGLEAYHRQHEMAQDEALPYLQGMLNRCLQTEDFREGISAFLQKREPNFKGDELALNKGETKMRLGNRVLTLRVFNRRCRGQVQLEIWDEGVAHLLCTDNRVEGAPARRVGSFVEYLSGSTARDIARTMELIKPERFSDHVAGESYAALEWPWGDQSVRFPFAQPPGEIGELMRKLRRVFDDVSRAPLAAFEISAEGGRGKVTRWSEPPLTFTLTNVGKSAFHVDPEPDVIAELELDGNGERWTTEAKCDGRNRDLFSQFVLPPGQRMILFPTGLNLPVPDAYRVSGAVLLKIRCADIPGTEGNRWHQLWAAFGAVTMDVE